jgi:hypothetical protein
MRCAAGQMHPTTGDFDEEQHTQALQPDGVDRKEIHGHHAVRLRPQELTHEGPGRWPAGPSCSARRIFLTVVADTMTPMPCSSPTIRW